MAEMTPVLVEVVRSIKTAVGKSEMDNIRNFAIIAHIDHGKSTLADRFLQVCGTIPKREFHEQVLDRMDLERERGITIKSHPVRLIYRFQKKDYHLNLIDTPGHIDFSYEVERSLAATEGAILLIDASQGVEAQTVKNFYLAKNLGLKIIPVINKIDLPSADTEKTEKEIKQFLPAEEVSLCSAKYGEGIEWIMQRVIKTIPSPSGSKEEPFKALVFDAQYNAYKGVDLHIRVFDGKIEKGEDAFLMKRGVFAEVFEVGIFKPEKVEVSSLSAGEVGYLTVNIRDLTKILIGDTITIKKTPAISPLPGYREIKPFVYCSLYPADGENFQNLGKALQKLHLNDFSFTYTQENSSFGAGFHCGFLGLLHMDIIQERLEREFNLAIVRTVPMVAYRVKKNNGEILEIKNPRDFPLDTEVKEISEPWLDCFIISPLSMVSDVIELVKSYRGASPKVDYWEGDRVAISISLPLAEILVDFYDRLNSVTHGLGSFDYQFSGYRAGNLVKIDFLINGKSVESLSLISEYEKAISLARSVLKRLRKAIPRQLFQVALQAKVKGKIVGRENVAPYFKLVTGKCYGGDISRKQKLRQKQKEGKKRLKTIGNLQLPQEAFLSIFGK